MHQRLIVRRIRTLIGVTVLAALLAPVTPAQAALTNPSSRDAVVAAGIPVKSRDSDASGKCLDVYNWGVGPAIQMYTCHGGANQRWYINPGLYQGYPVVVLKSEASGLCLDASRGSGQQMFQFRCDGSTNQQFYFWKITDVTWVLESVGFTGQCIDVYDWGRSNIVQLWGCHYGTNQQWYW